MPGNPLTKIGLVQAEKISNIFTNNPIDIIYSSPLLRTKQTAKIISKKVNRRVSYSKNLLDFRRSKAQEGLFVHEYTALPEFRSWKKFSGKNPDFSLADGESRNAFSSRVTKFALHCERNFTNEKILIVTHTDVIWQLVMYWTGRDIDKKTITNCTVIKTMLKNKYMVFKDTNNLTKTFEI